MKKKGRQKGVSVDSRGFSILEILLGISVFMIGMLGVTALNISSMKSNAFSGNLSEATMVASSKIEELMIKPFDDADLSDLDDDGNRITDQDADNDGIDDSGNNFGLLDVGCPDALLTVDKADYCDANVGKLGMYTVYWNVAEKEPLRVTPQTTKRINVIVEWSVKEKPRRISISTIRQKGS